MKTTTAKSRNVDILRNDPRSAQAILTAAVKRCRQSLGYLSVFATLPALLLPNLHEARTEEIKRTEAIVPKDVGKLSGRLNDKNTLELLRRQSKFRLPHEGNLSLPVDSADECRRHAIARTALLVAIRILLRAGIQPLPAWCHAAAGHRPR